MNRLPRPLHRGLAIGTACLLSAAMASACTAGTQKSFQPSLVWGPCPDDVEATFLSAHECGTLTVLADRARPRGSTVKLLVTKVPPPTGATMPGVGTSFGANFGDAESLGGAIAAGASRLGRTSLQLEWRGSGPHSTPSLRCPEVDPLGLSAAGTRHDDPGVLEAFVAAVDHCAKRLRSHGIEPGDYTSTAMAQDIEDLRVAARIDRWAMGASYGTQSAVLFEYLHLFPGRVEAAYLDSPSFSNPTLPGEAEVSLQAALDALFRACDRAPTCQEAHPDLSELWTRALDNTAIRPLRGTAHAGEQKVAVVVDAAKLVRATRFTLGGEGGPLTALPRIIDDAAHGRLAPELAAMVANDPMFCSGYRPQCRDHRFSLGVFLTHLCSASSPTPATTETTPRRNVSHSAYTAVFEQSPYLRSCDAWNVPARAAESPLEPIDVPLLLMSGDLDSFSPPVSGRTAAASLGPTAFVLSVPGGIHNVLGFYECAITARNQWTRRPQLPPPDNACASALPLTFQ